MRVSVWFFNMSLLVVDSAARTDTTEEPDDYEWKAGTPAPRNIRNLSLDHVCVVKPHNIIAGINNTITLTWSELGLEPPPDDYTVDLVVPTGSYTGTSLAAELTALLAAEGYTVWTVAFDVVTGRMTWTWSNGGFVLVSATLTTTTRDAAITFGITWSGGSGLTAISDPTVAITTTNEIDLTYPSYMYLRVDAQDTGSGGGVQSETNRYTFVVPMKEYAPKSLVSLYSLTHLQQLEGLNNLRPQSYRITWQWPNGAKPEVNRRLMFEGQNHVLIMRLY